MAEKAFCLKSAPGWPVSCGTDVMGLSVVCRGDCSQCDITPPINSTDADTATAASDRK